MQIIRCPLCVSFYFFLQYQNITTNAAYTSHKDIHFALTRNWFCQKFKIHFEVLGKKFKSEESNFLWVTALPHGNALLCKCTCFASFWPIVHQDPVNALFWNWVSWWRIRKRCPCVFVWMANPHTFRNDDAILQLTRLVVKCESQQQFDLINGPHKWFWLH